jgi:Family of unknown function (DUF6141)
MVYFHEEQRFAWHWMIPLMIPSVVLGYGVYRQVWQGRRFGDYAIGNTLLWSVFLVSLAVALWFPQIKLITEVRGEALSIRFTSLWPERLIAWSDIRRAETVTYRPIKDFGGYGVRWATGRGMVFNAHGNRGVRMELASGERVLVGSQRPEELHQAIAVRAGLSA